jgi:hypothetical protein
LYIPLFDEDFPDDLDGDGSITQMRKKDPNGDYKHDPEDPRLMVRVKPGEKGEYTMLGQEGIDNDGDGRVNKDSEGYVDPNRNWGYNWAPNYVQRCAVLFSPEQTPEISMEVFEKEEISRHLYILRVRLINSKAMPSITYKTVKNKLYPMDMLKVTGNDIEVVAGGEIQDRYRDQVNYKEHKPWIQFTQVPGFGHVEYEFLISGKGEVTIEFDSRKAGKKKNTILL